MGISQDVVYDVDLIPALVGTLSKLLNSKKDHLSPSTAIVTCTERNEETLNHFLSELGNWTVFDQGFLFSSCWVFYLFFSPFYYFFILVVQKLTYKELEHAPAIFACQRNYPVKIYEIIHSIIWSWWFFFYKGNRKFEKH